MSEYCHHCGTTISEDIATLCPLCASKPATLRREEIDEFAAKLTSGGVKYCSGLSNAKGGTQAV